VFASGALLTVSSAIIFPEAVRGMSALPESSANALFGSFLILGFMINVANEWLFALCFGGEGGGVYSVASVASGTAPQVSPEDGDCNERTECGDGADCAQTNAQHVHDHQQVEQTLVVQVNTATSGGRHGPEHDSCRIKSHRHDTCDDEDHNHNHADGGASSGQGGGESGRAAVQLSELEAAISVAGGGHGREREHYHGDAVGGSGAAAAALAASSSKAAAPPARARVPALVRSILLGDSLHNFCDGLAIGAAFKGCGSALGWTVAVGSIAHEVSQELSDYLMLTQVPSTNRLLLQCPFSHPPLTDYLMLTQTAGLTRGRALAMNFASGLFCVVGALVVFAAEPSPEAVGAMLAFSGGERAERADGL
jgi:zinc transporter ZupT